MPAWLIASLGKGLAVEVLKKLFFAVFTKKKIVGWIGAAAIAVGAAFAGMQSKEVRDAVCSATLIEAPQVEAK